MALALEYPDIWLQLYYDMELANDNQEDEQRPQWKKRGESDEQARDRLKRERQEAKQRLGVL